jgi:chromosome segregation ATPase
MPRIRLILLTALCGAAIVGCAKPPTVEVDGAKAALNSAKTAEAQEYAADSWRAAESAVARLDSELKLQEEKMGLFRNYDTALQYATEAKQAADKAASDAAQAKERLKTQATTLISQTRAAIEEVKGLLATAPVGKGSQVDLAVMKSDLEGVESALPEIEDALTAGRYRDAIQKSEAAMQVVEDLKTDLMNAMAAKESARKRAS